MLSEQRLELIVLVSHGEIGNGRYDLTVQRLELKALLDILLSRIDLGLETAVHLEQDDIDQNQQAGCGCADGDPRLPSAESGRGHLRAIRL